MPSLFDQLEATDHAWRPETPPELFNVKELALDTETNGLRWHAGNRPIGISICLPDGKAQYLPWGHRGGNLDEEVVRRWARQELRGKYLTGANIGFDVHMLREWGVDLEAQGCTVGDVQHYAAILDDNRRRFNLDLLSRDFLGRGKLGKELSITQLESYHAGQVATYAEEDVRLVHDLLPILRDQISKQELEKVAKLEEDLIFPICEMEKNAAPLDKQLLDEWVKQSERLWLDCLWAIAMDVGFQMNPDSSKDWIRLFKHFNIPIVHFTEDGSPSFTDLILKGIDNPIIQLARKAGKIASLRSKFLVAYRDALGSDNKLRYSLHQLRADDGGTVSGRFSCSNVNIQQVMTPAKQEQAFGNQDFLVRKLFIPEQGLYFSADAMQIEYRLFASYANNPAVIAAYQQNPMLSFHILVWDMVKKHLPNLPYRRAKDCNFAKLYGAGTQKLAEMLSVSMTEVTEINQIYDQMFPEVKKLLNEASRLAKRRKYVRTLLGRRARFPDGDRTHKALNRVIQGGAADIMKTKIVELHRERHQTNLTMRMTVHDEIDGDVPDAESAKLIAEILNTQSFPLRVPILWDTGIGANWATAK